MKEAILKIRDGSCSINGRGRISINNPFFTATIGQLTILNLIAQGLTVRQVALDQKTTSNTVATIMSNLRSENNGISTTALINRALSFDLLNLLTIEGIRAQQNILNSKMQNKPIDVTEEINNLFTVKV